MCEKIASVVFSSEIGRVHENRNDIPPEKCLDYSENIWPWIKLALYSYHHAPTALNTTYTLKYLAILKSYGLNQVVL